MTPLTPQDCDLRDFAFMPLDVARLRDSDLAALETPESCWAAVLLWAASWHQVPAASLPDDDRILSNLAGYGRVVKEWQRVRDGALRGWIKCTDGRLYHPVVAEKAVEAWESKQNHAYTKTCDRIRKENKRREAQGQPILPIPSVDDWRNGAGIPTEKSKNPPENHQSSAGNKEYGAGIPTENALTGTGTGTGTINTNNSIGTSNDTGTKAHGSRVDQEPSSTPYGEMASALRPLGVSITSANPILHQWIADGVTVDEALEAVAVARNSKPSHEAIPAKYLDAVIRGQREQQRFVNGVKSAGTQSRQNIHDKRAATINALTTSEPIEANHERTIDGECTRV